MTLSLPRVTCQWVLSGAETFRASSRKFFGTGTNLQNQPKGLRYLLKADPGKSIVQVDQAGAEALIVSYLTRHGNFRDLFLNGIKSHNYVGMQVFRTAWEKRLDMDLTPYVTSKVPDLPKLPRWKELNALIKSSDEWPSNERYYYIAKKLTHSANYGMRAPTFALTILTESEGQVRLTVPQASKLLEYYHTLFPEIRQWHNEIEREFRVNGYLRNLFGYPWYVYKPINDELLRKLIAFKAQSTVGCITHIAITQLQAYIEEHKLDWDILINGHDSIVAQVPDSEALECARVISKFINQRLVSPRGEEFFMKSEAAIGKNWGPHKPDKNPEGLVEVKL